MKRAKMSRRAQAKEGHESDVQMSDEGESDVEMELEDDDPEDQNLDVEEEDEGEDGQEEEEEEEDEIQSVGAEEEDDEPPSPPPQPRLKIKLRLPAHASSASTAASTPAPEDISHYKASSRRDIDIESEDEEEDVENELARSTPSTPAGPSSRPMTTRQAVLASVVDSTHVSLTEGSRKKKPLNESELALRREETARKRKNLSEKKLEDEKAETINRLLKKQSRAKNKRSALAAAEDRTPNSNTNNAAPPGTVADDESVDPEAENGSGVEPAPAPAVPIMYRWISSSRGLAGEGGEKKMTLSFSVPTSIIPAPPDSSAVSSVMDVDYQVSALRDGAQPECDVDGCYKARKYKFVKDWTMGACGMGHLKLLEASAR